MAPKNKRKQNQTTSEPGGELRRLISPMFSGGEPTWGTPKRIAMHPLSQSSPEERQPDLRDRHVQVRLRTEEVTKTVRKQYEKLPYPPRDPESDKRFLLVPMIDHLMLVNQYCYGGEKDFRDSFRILVAGGGTGDASSALAVQCAALPDVKIHYIDLSEESMKIAMQRLHNQAVRLEDPRIEQIVEFHHASLLDLGNMGLGEFDYINCAGVLHHLEDPSEGLKVLNEALKEHGAMGLMLYGQVGRTSVYQIQEMMRILNRDIEDVDEKIRNTNLLLQALPKTNLHVLNGRWKPDEASPIEIYDLFLHSNDRAYTIEELYDWVEGHGLYVNAFTAGLRSYLDPRFFPSRFPESVSQRLLAMPERQRQIVSEYLFGHINKLECYVTRREVPPPRVDEADVIPSFSVFAKNQNLPERLRSERELVSTFVVPDHFNNQMPSVSTTALCKLFFRELDGNRTFHEIREIIQTLYPRIGGRQYENEVISIVKTLARYDMLHLRKRHCRCEMLNCDRF